MSKNYINVNNLKISNELYKFVNEELLKDTNISPEKFWEGFDNSVHELAQKILNYLKKRRFYKKIDDWHLKIEVKKLI